MDWRPPDGYAAIKREDAKTVPIFAMSANTFIDDIAKSREAGMDEHFTKPLDIEVIREAIGRYCGRGRVFWNYITAEKRMNGKND